MWRSRMFWRLFSAYGLLVALALGLLGYGLIRRIESHLIEELRRDLETKTIWASEWVAARALPSTARQSEVARLYAETGARITLIAEDGRVIADSAEPPEQLDNHLDRPEIRQASANGTGSAIRYSATLREPVMYVARRASVEPEHYVRLALPLRVVRSEIGWLHGIVWTAVGVTILLSLMLSLVISRRISAPLTELAAAARSMARGVSDKPVNIASQDETGVLAVAISEMSYACATRSTQLEQDRQQLLAVLASMVEGVVVLDAEQRVQFLNNAARRLLGLHADAAAGRPLWEVVRNRPLSDAVEHTLDADEPYQGELECGTSGRRVLMVYGTRLPGAPARGAVLVLHDVTELRKLERVRQDFVANVSHELKTPLAAIQATAETLLDGALNDAEHNVRFLESIRENADRLHRLVQDLLSLGRIESGGEALDVQPTPVEPVALACLARVKSRAAAKSLRLEHQPPAEPLVVMADDDALGEILDNLLDNAVKYTPENGRVTLRWFVEDGQAMLEVDDTGIGIPQKDLGRVFERFYRVDKARSRELGGTGLGLSIVKHLVQALGGGVSATSQIGIGSKFTVRLPCAAAKRTTESVPDLHQISTIGS